MTEADYGEFSNYANWQSLLLIIVGAEMYNTLSRAYYDYTDDYDQYASSVTIAGSILTLIFYVIFLVSGSWIYKIVSIPQQFVHILFCTMICQNCKSVFLTKEKTLYRYKSATAISLLSLIVPTLISVVLVVLAPAEQALSARIYGFYVPYALLGLYCAFVLLKRGKATFKISHVKYSLVLALPLLVHYLTAYLLSSTNTIITKNTLGAETAAVVSITTSIMNILTMLFQAITGALTTWLMDQLEQKKISAVRRCSVIFTAAVAVVSVAVILMAPEVVLILGGSKYTDAIPLIPTLTVAAFFQITTTFFTIILTYDKSITKTAIYTSAVAVLSIVAKVLLMPKYGYHALPIINIAAFAFLFVVSWILTRKCGYGKCANIKVMALISVFVTASMALGYVLYEHTIIRYAIIAVCAVASVVVLYKTRGIWIKLIRKKAKKA